MNILKALLALFIITALFALAQGIPSTPGWFQIPNTTLQSVCPPNNFNNSGYDFYDSCPAVVTAWNSGAFDTNRNRLIVWGGGHDDYYGNEMYAVNLNTLTIERITDPTVPIASSCTDGLAGDTVPNSRHTYDGIAYMANVDRLFVFGGSLSPCGYFIDGTWTFDMGSKTWQKMNPSGDIPHDVPGIVTAYDPNTGNVYLHDDQYLYSYSFAGNSFQRLSGSNITDYHLSGTIDPVNGKFVMVGAGNVYVYDINPGSAYTRVSLATTGGSSIVNSYYPGLAFDSSQGKIVAWNGGDTVYVLDLESAAWSPITFSGGPGASPANGTYNRWSYSPASGVFVLVNAMDSNVFTLRLSESEDNEPPTIPGGLTASDISSNEINLDWNVSTDNTAVTGYEIYRDGSLIGASPTNSYQDTNLTPSTTYTYTVSAYDAAGNISNPSNGLTATTLEDGQTTSFQLTSEESGNLPFTVGLGFRKGDISEVPVLDIPDSQVIVKKRWRDNSVKYAIASGHAALTAGSPATIHVLDASNQGTGTPLTAADIQAAAPSATVQLDSIGTVNLSDLLASPYRTWISGPEMVEAHYRSSVGSDPSLTVWFHVRLYKQGRIFIRIVVENGYLDVGSSGKTYTPTVTIGGETVFDNNGLSISHYYNTRWSVEGWMNGDPRVIPKPDTEYLMDTKLVPNYMESSPDSSTLDNMYQSYQPMENGGWTVSMGDSGFQDQIGILPLWDALYLTSNGDPRAFRSVLANTEALNSYPILWTDSNTGLPALPSDRPTWTVNGEGGGGETSVGAGSLSWDVAHHGSGGYLAYLITGDYYYLETMQHQASLCYLINTAGNGLGTERIFLGQTRGAAWCQRTVGQLAAIGPDDPITADYQALLESNINYWNGIRQQVGENAIGYLYSYEIGGYGQGSVAPWQQAFWVQTYGYLSDIEPFSDTITLTDLRNFLYKSAVGILGPAGSDNYCYTKASEYTITISDTSNGDPTTWYRSWGDVFYGTFGVQNSSCGNTLEGGSGGDPAVASTGYWGNLMPAIAYAVDHGAPGASASWSRLTTAANWSTIQNSGFNNIPIWGIVPRAQSPSNLQPPYNLRFIP
jgi:hypothetical protein